MNIQLVRDWLRRLTVLMTGETIEDRDLEDAVGQAAFLLHDRYRHRDGAAGSGDSEAPSNPFTMELYNAWMRECMSEGHTMAECAEGYRRRHISVVTPRVTIRAPVYTDLKEGDPVYSTEGGQLVGFALEDSNGEGEVTIAIQGRMMDAALLLNEGALSIGEAATMLGVSTRMAGDALHAMREAMDRGVVDRGAVSTPNLPQFYASTYHGSMAMRAGSVLGAPGFYGGRTIAQTPRFQYTGSKFPKDVQEKAWNFLRDYMKPKQYGVFMENKSVELINETSSHRLLINKGGHFTILDGPIGEGIVVLAGRIVEREYPLGDEIAAFIDWFRHKTGELIARWNCGNFAIIDGDRTRW